MLRLVVTGGDCTAVRAPRPFGQLTVSTLRPPVLQSSRHVLEWMNRPSDGRYPLRERLAALPDFDHQARG